MSHYLVSYTQPATVPEAVDALSRSADQLQQYQEKYGSAWDHERALWERAKRLLNDYAECKAEVVRLHQAGVSVDTVHQLLRCRSHEETQLVQSLDKNETLYS